MITDNTRKYARVIEASQRVRWEIEKDVICGRSFDYGRTFLPTGLSLVDDIPFLGESDRRFLSQVQGRTYAFMFGLVERFIGAKALEVGRDHWLGDQVALEALVRMTDEELKHQALFRRLEEMMSRGMPAGYRQVAHPNDVGRVVLGKSTWAVLALTLDIELFTQAHFRASIEHGEDICPLWKDVFLFHWREESQHAVLDELELLRVQHGLRAVVRPPAQRPPAVRLRAPGPLSGLLRGCEASWSASLPPSPRKSASRAPRAGATARCPRRCDRRPCPPRVS